MPVRRRVTCNRCGAAMVIRRRRSDGGQFFGCTNYPDCRNIVETAETMKRKALAIQVQKKIASLAYDVVRGFVSMKKAKQELREFKIQLQEE